MNFLVADRIVSSHGVNIQLRASGAILHYKDSEELLHVLATECNDNFHFCFNVQTIPLRPFKTFSPLLIYTWKAITYQRSTALKFKRKLVSALCPLCQRARLIQHLKASQPEEDPCRCNWVQLVYTPLKKFNYLHNDSNQSSDSWVKTPFTAESREEPLAINSKPFLNKIL